MTVEDTRPTQVLEKDGLFTAAARSLWRNKWFAATRPMAHRTKPSASMVTILSRVAVEAGIGIVLGLAIFAAAAGSVTPVHFVYQGY
jgi:hypothetical protein